MLDTQPIQILPDAGASLAAVGDVLTPGATLFVADIVRQLRPEIERRDARHRALRRRARELPDFRDDTKSTREGKWRCRPAPRVFSRRRVGMLGPVNATAIELAYRSNADWFVADFEDATSPTFQNIVQGQADLRRALAVDADRRLTLFLRPRGLHVFERHFVIDDRPAPASVFDLALFCYHNALALVREEAGPFFFLPKLETREDASLWDEILRHIESALRIAPGTIKVAVSIDTISAAFQMNEILWALRSRCVALHFGRRELIFDFVKTRASDPGAVLPDCRVVMLDRAFLAAISALLVKTAHRRGVHAIGGLAAHVPISHDRARNAQLLALLRAEKAREAEWGYDGTLVADARLLPVARDVFDAIASSEEPSDVGCDDVCVRRDQLLSVPSGTRTEDSVRANMHLLLSYLQQWLHGNGFVEVEHGVVDAAAAEIARVQLWKWVQYFVRLDDGELLTARRFKDWLAEEAARLDVSAHVHAFVERVCLAPALTDFMMSEAYRLLMPRVSPRIESPCWVDLKVLS